ncbi:uclacyanin 1-like [Triticum dicoccoides]|uniref:uclacyanin 1-like n=1 Tax=Triticum dicoccoides TaxID=85692 RepID=UPI00188DEB61|nr:uclacyanin 1-like [Triticum dicoccoides]
MGAKVLILITLVVAMLGMVLGASHTVGASAGSWDLQTNYTPWASRTRFTIGDELQFQYSTTVHNVVEVRKAGYDACNSSSPIAMFLTGNDIVPLAAIGTRYFICGVSGHCIAGMKVQVNVKSKAVRTIQRCRGTGKWFRCRYETVLSSATVAGIDQSARARPALNCHLRRKCYNLSRPELVYLVEVFGRKYQVEANVPKLYDNREEPLP